DAASRRRGAGRGGGERGRAPELDGGAEMSEPAQRVSAVRNAPTLDGAATSEPAQRVNVVRDVIETRALRPFGLEVRLPPLTSWEALDAAQVEAWVAEHRVVVLRGLRPFTKAELPAAARRLGPLQAWSFGSVNELRPEKTARNYLYADREVP